MCRFRLNGSIHKALDDSDPQQVALILDSPYDIWLGRGREIRRCLMTEIVEWPAQLVEVLTPARRRKLVNLISELYGQSKDDEDYRFISALVPILVAAGDSSDRRYLLSIGRLYCGSEQQKAVRQMIRDNVEAKDARPDLLRAASAPVDRDLLHTLDESVINRESELLRAGECHLAQHSDSGGGAPADG
jgi:hypothetical protein